MIFWLETRLEYKLHCFHILTAYKNAEKKVTRKVHISEKGEKNVGSLAYFQKKGKKTKFPFICIHFPPSFLKNFNAKCEMAKITIKIKNSVPTFLAILCCLPRVF